MYRWLLHSALVEATISMKLLEKITMNFVWTVFEQMHCGSGIALRRENGTPLISQRLLCSTGARAGGGLSPPAALKLALGWSCWKFVLSSANSASYA